MRRIPLLLTSLRAALAPVVALLAVSEPSRPAFALCLIVAFLTDVLDGIIARRLGVATPGLRRLDSIADSLFYAAATFAAWRLYPESITRRIVPIFVLGVLELGRYALDAIKFRREASYHMWSSKLWGLVLFVAFYGLLVLGSDGFFLSAAIALGILADLEGLVISLVLSRWTNDVPTVFHAIALRRAERN